MIQILIWLGGLAVLFIAILAFALVLLLSLVVALFKAKPKKAAPRRRRAKRKPDPATLEQLLHRRVSLTDAVDDDLQRQRERFDDKPEK